MEDKKVLNEMGFDIKETSQNEDGQPIVELTEIAVNGCDSAEKTLKVIALMTLILGIIAVFVMLFTICFVPKYGDHGRSVFNPLGFGITCGVLISTLISWASLNVFANISLTLKKINSKFKD